MTHTEAAGLILRATTGEAYLVVIRAKTHADILAAVATVMDAARADAFRDAAMVADGVKYPPEYREHYEIAERAGFDLALEYAADSIRNLAQSHREPKP